MPFPAFVWKFPTLLHYHLPAGLLFYALFSWHTFLELLQVRPIPNSYLLGIVGAV